MTMLSRLLGLLVKLPPAASYDVIVERDLPVPMPDGVTLLADRYIPPRGATHLPTILVRSCYGRGGVFGMLYGQLFAERGFQVVIQSTRGTADSGGELDPFGSEHADGLATLAWLRLQPWFSGQLATNGASYLGFVQWAIASEAGPELRAMALQVTASEFRNQTYAGESFTLDTALTWTQLMYHLKHSRNLQGGPATSQLQPLYSYLPLRDLDMLATDHEAPFYQEWLTHTEPGDPYWLDRSFDDTVRAVAVPINMVGGWYDIFLPWMLRDYLALRAAGHQPFLTIGPWGHSSLRLLAVSLRESLTWFQAHLLGKRSLLRTAPVRIFVTGSNQWLDLADWPPPHQAVRHLYLQPSARLSLDFPAPSEPDHYRYDPADPTPAVAGPHLSGQSGPTDNRQLEARSDVLTYTSAHLTHDVTLIGPVQAELFVHSSLANTDFFVRLCDVYPQGSSLNVCDGILRLKPGQHTPAADGTLHLTIDLWPTAHCFYAGHKLRLQVSSGAHPRFARNTGSGEPLATAIRLIVADQSIYHDPAHLSCLTFSTFLQSE